MNISSFCLSFPITKYNDILAFLVLYFLWPLILLGCFLALLFIWIYSPLFFFTLCIMYLRHWCFRWNIFIASKLYLANNKTSTFIYYYKQSQRNSWDNTCHYLNRYLSIYLKKITLCYFKTSIFLPFICILIFHEFVYCYGLHICPSKIHILSSYSPMW